MYRTMHRIMQEAYKEINREMAKHYMRSVVLSSQWDIRNNKKGDVTKKKKRRRNADAAIKALFFDNFDILKSVEEF